MRKVCAKKRDELRTYFNASPPPVQGQEHERNRHLLNVAEAFVDMLQHRQTADYDGSKAWSRVEVRGHVETVKEAFASWKIVKDQDEAQSFLVSLLLKDR